MNRIWQNESGIDSSDAANRLGNILQAYGLTSRVNVKRPKLAHRASLPDR